MASDFKPETLAAQALGWDEPAFHGIVPPIYPSTTYARPADDQGRHGRMYSRDANPTYDQAEALLNALEGGAGCRLFSSGMAAASAVFQTLGPGDHVVVPTVTYHGVRTWLKEQSMRWGLGVDFVANGDLEALAAAMRPGETKLVWLETPCNPMWDIADIAASAAIAHGAGARLAVDSTVASPVLTNPLEHGADIVMHSATKYLNGHSDVLGGALVTAADDDHWKAIGEYRHIGGAVLGPFEAWLLLRGMRTLYIRMRACSASAQAIAEHFHGHPKIARVLYPGLAGHPGHDLAARQMKGGFGGMLSLRIAGGPAAALRLSGACRLFKRATSLGGVESLIEHRAGIEPPDSPVPPDLLRLSVGIEDTDDLIADLERGLKKV
ncbi:MAG: PLP-dependent transferase [Proteobacteria bacterium]|nr:PLP-dependent transferase [Pseudomonadota bacterium]